MDIHNKKIIKLRKVLHANYGYTTFCLQYNEQNKCYDRLEMEQEGNTFFLEKNVLITSQPNYFYLLPNDSNHYYKFKKLNLNPVQFHFEKVEVEDDTYTKTDLNEECIENVVNLDFPCYFRRANTQSKDTFLSILVDKKKIFLDTHVPSYEIIKVLSLYCLAKRDFSKILDYLKYFIEQESEDTYSFRTRFFLSIENMCYLRYKENDKEKLNDLKNIINSVYLAHTLQFGQENIMDNLCLFFFYYTINSDIIIGENYNLKISLESTKEKEYIYQIHQSKIVILGNRNKKNRKSYEVYNQSIKEERFRRDILRKLKKQNFKKEEVSLKTLLKVGKDIGYEEEYINKYFKKFGDNFYSEYMKYQFIDDKTKVSSIQQKKKDTEKKHNTNKIETKKSYFNIDKSYPFNKIKDDFKNKFKLKEINWDILEKIYDNTDTDYSKLTKYDFPVFDNFVEIQNSNVFIDLDSLIFMIYLDFLYPDENRHNMMFQKQYIEAKNENDKKKILSVFNNEWKRQITKQMGLQYPELVAHLYVHKISIKNINVLVGNYNHLKKLDRIRESNDNDKLFCILKYIKSVKFTNTRYFEYFKFKKEVQEFGACLLEKYMKNTIDDMNFPKGIFSNKEIQRYVRQFIQLNEYNLYQEKEQNNIVDTLKKDVIYIQTDSRSSFKSVFDPDNIKYLTKIAMKNKDEIELNVGLYVLYQYHKISDADNRVSHLAFRLDFIYENEQYKNNNLICFQKHKNKNNPEGIIILPNFRLIESKLNVYYLELILELQRKIFDFKVIHNLLQNISRVYSTTFSYNRNQKIYSISYQPSYGNIKKIYDDLLFNLHIYSLKGFLLNEFENDNKNIIFKNKMIESNFDIKKIPGLENIKDVEKKRYALKVFLDFQKMFTNVGENVPDYVSLLERKKIKEYPELQSYIKEIEKKEIEKKTMNQRIQYLLTLDEPISFPHYQFYSDFYNIIYLNLPHLQKLGNNPITFTNEMTELLFENWSKNFLLYKINIKKLKNNEDLLSFSFPCNKYIDLFKKQEKNVKDIYLRFEISKAIEMISKYKTKYPIKLYFDSVSNIRVVKSNLRTTISNSLMVSFYNDINLKALLNMKNTTKSISKRTKKKLPSNTKTNTKKKIQLIDLT